MAKKIRSAWQLYPVASRPFFAGQRRPCIRSLDSHIAEMQELVNDQRLSKRSYLGLQTNFPILMEKLNGFQKEFYLITGGVGMGKSTFATQLAWDLVSQEPLS